MPSKLADELKSVKIKNPKTGKDIKLSSALSYGTVYGKDDKAYLAAVSYVKKHVKDSKDATISTGSGAKKDLSRKKTHGVKDPAYQKAIKALDTKVARQIESLPTDSRIDPSTIRHWKDSDEMDKHLYEEYKAEYAILKIKNISSFTGLARYTHKYYQTINGCLRGTIACDPDDTNDIAAVSKIMADAPPLKENTRVYRGMYGKEMQQIFLSSVGGSFTDKGFCSTTGIEQTMRSWADSSEHPIHVSIDLPKGTRGIGVNNYLEDKSFMNDEGEFLLPAGSQFKVKSAKMVSRALVVELEHIVSKPPRKKSSPARKKALEVLDAKVAKEISSMTVTPEIDPSNCKAWRDDVEMDKDFLKDYGKEYAALRDTHRSNRPALKRYTLQHHERINKCLRSIGPCAEESKKDAAAIQKIIADAPPLKEDVLVHRGLKDQAIIKSILENMGGILTDGGFVSTSADPREARAFVDWIGEGGAQLDIVLPKGTKGLSINQYLRTGSRNPQEAEFLLPKGAQFRIKESGTHELGGKLIPKIQLEYIVGSGLD